VAIDPGDRLELHELAARYGNLVDARDLDALDTVFTNDATFVLTRPDGTSDHYDGIPEIRHMMESTASVSLHHVTNVVIEADGDGVILTFRVLAPGAGNRVASADYRDMVVRTPDGWRITEHVITVRPPRG
jgi:ketosteroid isomerase-like protein